MISEKILKAIEEQINFELESAYLYLAMSLKMDDANFTGFSHWLFKQYQEELDHAHEMIDYVQRRGHTIALKEIPAYTIDSKDPAKISQDVLDHEIKVSRAIDNILELARNEKDYATEHFMMKFVEEQVEEEESARELVDSFSCVSGNLSAQMMVDSMLSRREG
ncbi:MAG TPA: ferritin [Clostridiaceae bacterium]|nr:ferritin [Clostridiaceae bacterium]